MALPNLLAGPIVRRVAGSSVAVWIALGEPASIELNVWPGIQRSTGPGQVESGVGRVATGNVNTRRLGAKLHMAVVVAEASGTAIVPGIVHSYDLTINGKNLRDLGLLRDEVAGEPRPAGVANEAPLHLALGYELDRLPTFATAAPLLSDLCIASGSCRRTNFNGPDAMAYLDDLIAENRSDVARRPQQLFLTGDQIYADDLSSCLLPQLNAIGTEMMGFEETLPVNNNDIPVSLTNFPATRRRRTVRDLGRFTTLDGENHTLSFSEFVALHLISWSPRLWRALAPPAEIFKAVDQAKIDEHHLQDWEAKFGDRQKWQDAVEEGFLKETQTTAVFAAAVPRVARVLANASTYMIWDDHEITDDWYISKSWRSRVITAPFGRAVMRNGFAAYSVCQAWGNEPAIFTHEGAGTKPKGEEMLDTLEAFAAAGSMSTAQRDKLDTLFGLGDPAKEPEMTFHYSVPSTLHMVRVLDTRSRRKYKGRLGPPKLVVGETLDKQLPKGPLTDGRELLVVVSPGPILFPRIFDTLIQPLASQIFDFAANVKEKAEPDENGPPITGNEDLDVEGWGSDEESLEAMIKRLGTYAKAIILSGDVHFASSLALDYWTGADPTVDSRIIQFTSSGVRNAANPTRQAIIRSARFSQQLLRGLPFERLGWTEASSISVPAGKPVSPARRTRMRRSPALLPASGWPAGTTIPANKQPDWRWRLTVLRDETPRSEVSHPERLQPPLPPFNDADPLAAYDEIAAVHAQLASSPNELLRTLVFRTNVGVIKFEPDGADHTVVNELWSIDGINSTEGGPFTEHRASLALSPAVPVPQLQVVPDG